MPVKEGSYHVAYLAEEQKQRNEKHASDLQ
jgi:hypothetical protein